DQIDRDVNPTRSGLSTAQRAAAVPLAPAAVGPGAPTFSFRGSSYWAQGLSFGLELHYQTPACREGDPRTRTTPDRFCLSVLHPFGGERDAPLVAYLQAFTGVPDERLARADDLREVGLLHLHVGHLVRQQVGEDPPPVVLLGRPLVPLADEVHLHLVRH